MYYKSSWDIEAVRKICRNTWGTSPDLSRVKLLYGDRDISEHSNIVFVNGDMDPWFGGGVLDNITDSIIALTVDHGAHNYDLLFSMKEDLPSVKEARNKEKSYIRSWIQKWREKMITVEKLIGQGQLLTT